MAAAYIFHAGSGTTVNDYAGTNDGTLDGATTWATANEGIEFPNPADDVDLASALSFGDSNSLTFRFRRTDGGFRTSAWGYYPNNDYFWQNSYAVRVGSCDYINVISDPLIMNTYTFVRESTGVISVYVNGVFEGAGDGTCFATNPTTGTALGSGHSDPDNSFGLQGVMEYSYHHTKALTAQEAQDLHNHPYSMFHD